MSLRRSVPRLFTRPKTYDAPPKRPVITRTRSWRGLMQVRYDDSRGDRNTLMRQFFFWSPIRVFGSGILLMSFLYFYLGHDEFMYNLFGFESEAQVESKVQGGQPVRSFGDLLGSDRAAWSSVRKLEKPLHPEAEFDIFKGTERTPPPMK